MWQGKLKALTFSYDDGVLQDRRLVELFNRYGMRGTFNLNSGLFSTKEQENGWNEHQRQLRISHILAEEARALYSGHEVAVHSRTHQDLTALSDEQLKEELEQDKAALEELIGEAPVGMAYPYGTNDERVQQAVAAAGLRYARTIIPSYSFDLPQNPLAWNHTCHHAVDSLFDLGEAFLALTPDTPQLFSVWGHSYEFDVIENWDHIERFCEMMAGRDDIAYITNREALGL